MGCGTDVILPDGTVHHISRLFARSNSNAKIRKISQQYEIAPLSMLPWKIDGLGNVCTSASKECIRYCINISGLTHGNSPVRDHILRGRLARRVLFFGHREIFRAMWHREMDNLVKRAKRKGRIACCRPNMFSDVSWCDEEPELITRWPNVTFYGYTKHKQLYLRFLNGQLPTNFYLTLSRSEVNEDFCLEMLARGGTVAWVFRVPYSAKYRHPVPETYMGFRVIDGDDNDLRFLDPKGVVIALRAKGRARLTRTAFATDPEISLIPA